MISNSMLQHTNEPLWLRGFANLFRKENRQWWATRRWLVQCILWTVVVNGMVALVLFGVPRLLEQVDPAEAATFEPVTQGVQALFQIGTLALAIGAVILTHDQILGERLSGVTEWILSKPVSRVAYILSKLLADTFGLVITQVTLQVAIAYGLISLARGSALSVAPFVLGAGGLALHTLFYMSLTLLMGVLTVSRGKLLGVPLGILFGGLLVTNFLGKFALFTPWCFAAALPAAVLGLPLPVPIWVPLLITAALTLGAIGATISVFLRLEF